MQRRKLDRAQRMRARRIWWDRHGSFVRGALSGAFVTLLAVWLLQALLSDRPGLSPRPPTPSLSPPRPGPGPRRTAGGPRS